MNKSLLLGLSYLSLPFLIFAFSFLKLYLGIPLGIFLVYCIYKAAKESEELYQLRLTQNQCVVLAILSLALCYLSGIGAFYSQTGDYLVKNALLRDLCNTSWPMYIDLEKEPLAVQNIIGHDKVAFVYYLFFYLPAALVGKCFGLLAARLTFLLWSSLGLYLVLLYTVSYVSKGEKIDRKTLFLMMALFLCFGGLDALGAIRKLHEFSVKEILIQWPIFSFCETWCLPFFRLWGGNIHDLAFVFNQCIPAWLLTVLILRRDNNKSMFLVYSFSLLYTPWAAIGLFPIVIYLWLLDANKKWYSWRYIKETLNVRNVVFPLLLLFVVGSYYTSNSQSVGTKGWFFEFMSIGQFLVYYPLFLLVEIGLYAVLLREQIKYIPILQVSFMVLLALPFYHITPGNDLLMRASIPALFVIYVYWSKWAIDNFVSRKFLIVAVMLVTSVSAIQQTLVPMHLIAKEHKLHIVDPIGSFYHIQTPSEAYMCDFQFFAHDYKQKFFFKYLAK